MIRRRRSAIGARWRRVAALTLLLPAIGGATASAETRVFDLLIEREGLPALHEEQENGPPVMWLPQFRLFDGDGRPLWTFTRMRSSWRAFSRELDRRIAAAEPLAEGRTLRQEARYFLRRGGLPLNLTTLPAADLTVVEYWTADCQQCASLSRAIERYFDKAAGLEVTILRVFVADLE